MTAVATRAAEVELTAYLRLGRVSNLPTVWTNVLAGAVLAGRATVGPGRAGRSLALALSLFYVGGMYLNDAFDREIDARERPERPIPSGRIGAGEVFALGFGLLGAGRRAARLAGAAAGGGRVRRRAGRRDRRSTTPGTRRTR